jgi:ribonuclease E
VRARALAAAHAAANAKAVAARESQSPRESRPGTEAGTAAARGPSWFERIRRRWAFPLFSTFATVAALAVFLLARGTIFREAQHPLGERTLDELAPTEGAAPAPPAPAPRAPSLFEGARKRREIAPRESAAPDQPGDARQRRFEADEAFGFGASEAEVLAPGGPTDHGVAPSSESGPDDRGHGPGKAAKPSNRRRAALGAASAVAADSSSAPRPREFAMPPPAVSPAAASPTAATKPMAAAVPLASPTPDVVRSSPARKSASRARETPTGASAGSPADAAATLAARGEAAMAAHHWNEAAAIYHRLLRSYPKDAAAATWSGKLAAAEAATAAEGTPFAAPPPSAK